FYIMLMHEDVDCAAYAELRQVDARLNRAAGRGEQDTLIPCLKIIHICSIGMHHRAYAVPCPMNEILAIACLGNTRACSIIHLPALDTLARRQLLTRKGYTRIARSP